jgi:RHS repeat-associated protein
MTYGENKPWRDYFAGQVYSDFQVDVGEAPLRAPRASPKRPRQGLAGPGLAQQDAASGDMRYHHGDLIDSSMLLTDGSGDAVSTVSYTAFGEPIISGAVGAEFASGQPRHGYAGGWGYESGHYQDPAEGSNLPGFTDLLALYGPNGDLAPITMQHVGFRWYQPGIGRFVQRDPIGIDGGLNGYVYCVNDPVNNADPEGLLSVYPGTEGLPRTPNGWIKMPPGTRPKLGPDRIFRPVPEYWPSPAPAIGAGAAGGVAVCVVAAGFIGFTAGTALNDWHPGTASPYSDYIGNWLYRASPRFWQWSARKKYWIF